MSSLKFTYEYESNLDSSKVITKEDYTTLIPLSAIKNVLGLVLTETYDDDYLTDLLNASCSKVEKYINKSITTSQYEAVYSEFSDSTFLPYGVATNIVSVTDQGNTVDTDQYTLKNGYVYNYNSTNQVVITYDVTITEVDVIIKAFVYSMVKYMYDPNTFEMPDMSKLDCLTRRAIF